MARTKKPRTDADRAAHMRRKKKQPSYDTRPRELWEIHRKFPGQRVFQTPEDMWDKAVEYFEWVKARAVATEITVDKKTGEKTEISHAPVVFHLSSFFAFVGMTRRTFLDYEQRPGFEDVTAHIREVIRTNQFDGAAVNLYNAGLIAKEIGLADRVEATVETAANRIDEIHVYFHGSEHWDPTQDFEEEQVPVSSV